MEKSVYVVWHLGSVIYVGSTMNLIQRRAGHICDARGNTKVAGLVDYMRKVFSSGGKIRKFEFAFEEVYRGKDWESVEEKTIADMRARFPNKLLNRSTLAVGNNSTHYKRIPPKVTRAQIEKSIHTRRTTDCMKTEKVYAAIKKAVKQNMMPVLVDGVEFESFNAAARFLGTSPQTVRRAINGMKTPFTGRLKLPKGDPS